MSKQLTSIQLKEKLDKNLPKTTWAEYLGQKITTTSKVLTKEELKNECSTECETCQL